MKTIILSIQLIINILLSPLMAAEDLTRDIASLEDQITEAFGKLTGTQLYFDQINAELNKLRSGTSTDTKSTDGIADKERISFFLREETNTQEDILVENKILYELLSDYQRLTGVDFVLPEETPTAPPVATVSSATTTHESSTYTPTLGALKANTHFCRNGFTITYVGRPNKEQLMSLSNLLKQANQNSLLPVQFVNPALNLCQLKLDRPNKTPSKPTEPDIET